MEEDPMGRRKSAGQGLYFPTMIVALVPPKPKELLMAMSTVVFRATLGT